MTKQEKEHRLESLKFKIDSFHILNYRLNAPPHEYQGKAIPLHFNTKCITGVAQDLETVIVVIQVMVAPQDKKELEIIYLETQTIFGVQNISDWVEDDDIDLPKEFWTATITTSLGTTRGILMSKTGDSIYQKITMPIINIVELIPKTPFKKTWISDSFSSSESEQLS